MPLLKYSTGQIIRSSLSPVSCVSTLLLSQFWVSLKDAWTRIAAHGHARQHTDTHETQYGLQQQTPVLKQHEQENSKVVEYRPTHGGTLQRMDTHAVIHV